MVLANNSEGDSCPQVNKSGPIMNYENLQKCTEEIQTSLKNRKTLSYYKGDTSEPLSNLTIGQTIEKTASLYPNRTAISYFGGQKLTYTEVMEKIDALAAAYIKLGLKKGDHLAIWGFNTIEWYLSFLGAFRAGIVVVNLNPFYMGPEVLTCLKIGDIKALIMDEKLNTHNFYDILKSVLPELEEHEPNTQISSKITPLLKSVIIISEQTYRGTFKWIDLFTKPTMEEKLSIKNNQFEISAFDICNIQFTSGTTSIPKGVQLTHHNMVNNAHLVGKYLELYEKEHRVCVQVPFFHTFGAVAGIFGSIKCGSTLVIPNLKFSPNKSIDCIIQEKCTAVFGTPTMYIDLITVSTARQATDPEIFEKMSCVERFYTGGAMCLPEVILKLMKHFKSAKFTSGYGMTETSPTTFMTLRDDPLDVCLSYIGRVLDHTEVKVVNEDGQIVPFGTPGEMCFKGYMVMKGYYKEPEKTRAVLTEDGWFHSGDRFVLTENGYAQIVGRIKDIIIRGGENIEPKEIEALIMKHPDIIDVQVYGVSDRRLGETVGVGIVKTKDSKLTDQDIRKMCEGVIAPYKIPQYITFVDEFPKTASGKVQKFKLKEMTEKQLNLGP